ncbi:MAG: LysM peptidoglycan-binding domain-containing protein [Planctomycetaceae bacterium]|nr:LysM peptidoglycan-binding domain-containing protein [Planctomycetaceae bacterium]
MHRDKKIGFALGILLVGIVAAFFFRNEPDPFAELPPLDDPAALDGQIAEKPISPYTDDPNAPVVNGANARAGNQWDLPEFYKPNAPNGAPGPSSPVSPGAPAPIELAEPVPEPTDTPKTNINVGNPFGGPTVPSQPDSKLPGNEAWTAVPDNPTPSSPTPAQPQPPSNLVQQEQPQTPPVTQNLDTPPTFYKIKQGDTLSVLAETHLGTSRRYMEIYQANRDKLRNPDDIKVGMTIRIPSRVSFQDKPANSPSAEATNQPGALESLGPPPESASRFRPFSRSPLAPSRN